MNPHDAQASLDAVRRLQDRTRDEIVRQSFSPPFVILAALGLFVAFASTDLERPWNFVGGALGAALYGGIGILREHRACTRRKFIPQELLFHLGLLAFFVVIYSIGRIAAWALLAVPAEGLPSQAMVGAALAAVAYVAATPLNRRALKAIVRQDGGPI
ncbi:hypothetical protein [Nonomuraea rhodomycinica]|uniref:Uncharacterized protein n=1 Tax=Nonomuraea rhodomycinica TaxID=1712872 RepID=A0A7Y6IXZ9_9ACTN|nr:hypothetical protein [Nonomuraea rhodomycinica]NUW46215.1 hypothetical protein [Nonomuraea rhodomycinica]